MYPLDIHSEISLSSKSKPEGKGIIVRLILAGLALLLAVGGNMLLGYLGIPFLGFIGGLILGIWIALMVWNKYSEKEEALLENPDENKAMKFFRITLGREEFIDKVPVIEYSNGDKTVILSISLGNQTAGGQTVITEFLDTLFSTCHKNKIKFKIFTTVEEWEDSDIYGRLLNTYGRIHDEKLKAVLFESINVQSEEFSKSKIMQMNFIFIDREFDLNKLRTVIDYVESFRSSGLKLSSFRSMRWNTQETAVRLFCRFLGIKLIDSSPLADKTNVYLDMKSLVRPFNPNLFYTNPKLTGHLTNTQAHKVRSPNNQKRG